jgi:hypothetical protein
MPWGPVFFGVLIFAPMWAAAMDATHLSLPIDIPNIAFTLLLGFCWGCVAKARGRWL